VPDGRLQMGYVGCGFMAQNVHLPNFSSIAGCRLLGLAERRPRLGRLVADRFGIERLYPTHEDLASDPDIQAVAVSAGFAEQGEIAADLLRAGKHVFMEKPMALSIAQGERILAAEEAGDARLMVGYMKRYDPGNRLARETIRSWRADGSRGRPTYARNHGFCGNWTSGLDTSTMLGTDEPQEASPWAPELPDWITDKTAGEQYVWALQQFTHNVNLLRFMLDAGDDVQVRAVDLDPDGQRGVVVFEMAGTRAVLEAGALDYHDWDEHTQVYFEGGWVHAFSPPLLVPSTQARVETYAGGDQYSTATLVAPQRDGWAFREEARHFVRSVLDGAEFDSSARDTMTDVRLFEEIFRHHLGVA
jgi:predicted dehydrogenase